MYLIERANLPKGRGAKPKGLKLPKEVKTARPPQQGFFISTCAPWIKRNCDEKTDHFNNFHKHIV